MIREEAVMTTGNKTLRELTSTDSANQSLPGDRLELDNKFTRYFLLMQAFY